MSNQNKGKNSNKVATTQNNEAAVNQTAVSTNNETAGEVKHEPIAKTFEIHKVEKVADGKMIVELEGIGKISLPQTDRKQILTNIPGTGKVLINIKSIQDKPGRPVDPSSDRQKRLAEMEEKRTKLAAEGIELKRGRPAVPGSERQTNMMNRAQRLIEATKALPQYNKYLEKHGGDENAALAAMNAAGLIGAIEMRGRPADPTSDSYQKRLKQEQRKAENGGVAVLGRPTSKNNVLEIEAVEVLTEKEVTEMETETINN